MFKEDGSVGHQFTPDGGAGAWMGDTSCTIVPDLGAVATVLPLYSQQSAICSDVCISF
jgi:hypothetical protein